MNKYLQVIRKAAIEYKGSYSDEGVNPYELAMYECNGYIEKLEQLNEFLKKQLHKYQKTMRRYQSVLEKYEDENNWIDGSFCTDTGYDCYELAQEVLKEEEK